MGQAKPKRKAKPKKDAKGKTLFGEVFSRIHKALRLTEADIADQAVVGAASVHSWKYSPTLPDGKLGELIDAVIDATAEDKKVQFCANIRAFNQKLQPVWEQYGVHADDNVLSESDSFDDMIKTLLTVAYDNRNGVPLKRRLVAFDVDGTLIKGIRHSWTVLWQAIGKGEKEATQHKKAFEEGKLSYEAWCKSDLEALRAGGLTMEKVKIAAENAGCTLTNRLREAVDLLHKNNCKVAIISGGADCLLYALLPDADKIFDAIFINRCVFGADGVIAEIIPTKYDWDKDCLGVQGKEGGFELLCERYGAAKEDSVFVGDDRNDYKAMAMAGMKILYESGDGATRGFSSERPSPADAIRINKDDLYYVAERIVRWQFGDDVD